MRPRRLKCRKAQGQSLKDPDRAGKGAAEGDTEGAFLVAGGQHSKEEGTIASEAAENLSRMEYRLKFSQDAAKSAKSWAEERGCRK